MGSNWKGDAAAAFTQAAREALSAEGALDYFFLKRFEASISAFCGCFDLNTTAPIEKHLQSAACSYTNYANIAAAARAAAARPVPDSERPGLSASLERYKEHAAATAVAACAAPGNSVTSKYQSKSLDPTRPVGTEGSAAEPACIRR